MTTQQSSLARFFIPIVVTLAIAISCGGREDAAGTSAAPDTPAVEKELASQPSARPAPGTVALRPSGTGRPPGVTRIVPENGANTIDLPEDFPADVPLHPDSRPVRYVSSQKSGTMTVLIVDESPDSARHYYTSALEGEGWTIDMDGASSDLLMLSASKRHRSLAVAIAEDDGETTITLIEGSE